ncbi:MAG: PQQ-binding-like beta-propeller repeat protein [Pirellulaceae bacterium]
MPDQLNDPPRIDWNVTLASDSLGGISATDEFVVVGGRDLLDKSDEFICFDAKTGVEIWRHLYPASVPKDFKDARNGKLDFGNSPRATPVIVGEKVITLGAFGHLHCLKLESGEELWATNLLLDFGGKLPTWGFVGTPLVVDNSVYVQTTAPDAALVALDLETGDVRWQVSGNGPVYASLMLLEKGPNKQIVGWDTAGAVGWKLDDGQRMWSVKPEEPGEFLVPTPVFVGNRMLLVGENNGTRLHEFDDSGLAQKSPLATYSELSPDSHTPVVVGSFVVGVHHRLVCLNGQNLELLGFDEDRNLGEYGSLISDGQSKTLLLTAAGHLFLHRYTPSGQPIQLARLKLADEPGENYSHPALVGKKFYYRIGKKMFCMNLE